MANDNIIDFFEKRNSRDLSNYKFVKLKRDINGMFFNEEKLLDYAKTCHYIVRVMTKTNDEIALYNFDVPSDNLFEFLQIFQEDTSKGTVIEIEKFIPKGSA